MIEVNITSVKLRGSIALLMDLTLDYAFTVSWSGHKIGPQSMKFHAKE